MTLMSDRPIGEEARLPAAALLLGWAGDVPFGAGALALLLAPPMPIPREDLVLPVLAYGAVILSFLGGVRWGAALNLRPAEARARELAWAVVPSLVAWIALSLHARPVVGLAILAAAHVAQGVADVRAARLVLVPAWYGTLRVQLAGAATLALLVALVALVLRP